jgi:hypoxanthine phosphoribosyltransferase
MNKVFKSHSGKQLEFKIECDVLTEQDIITLAKIIAEKYKFRYVYGIPKGGLRLANELNKYCEEEHERMLIIDDVLTTGQSMKEAKKDYSIVTKMEIQGVVIFARGECPDWVDPIFKLWQ